MAENTPSEQLEKREPERPEPDPIADRSLATPILVSSMILLLTLIWSLYDEMFGMRPWRKYQRDFVTYYGKYLEDSVSGRQSRAFDTLKQDPEFDKLSKEYEAARLEAKGTTDPLQAQLDRIDQQINDVTPKFQDRRSWIVAETYKLEVAESESAKNGFRQSIEKKKKELIDFDIHDDNGVVKSDSKNFPDLEALYNSLRDKKGQLLSQVIAANQPRDAAKRKLDAYEKDNLTGLTPEQVKGVENAVERVDFRIRQINSGNAAVVDRCESCHLGAREPVNITKEALIRASDEKIDEEMAAAFVSHPQKTDLFRTHDPERFGCSTCHGGNGRGTTSVEKAHGRYKHWLWPLYYKENVQAGCNQCHGKDRVLQGAEILNRGKNLFQVRGCAGCHRYEAFDREADALAGARQNMKTLQLERDDRRREITQTSATANQAQTDEEAAQLLKRVDALRQMISQLETRIDEFDLKAKYLMQDVKKIGPNLKEIKAKLVKDWLPVWLADPQAFRPGTKMPTFRLNDEETRAISAFLWQSALDVKIPAQPPGDANHGRDLFKTLGCLGCHSIQGESIGLSGLVGGDFAANLSRVGEKNNYDYVVRWVHNPRQRLAPYSPSEKRDLTPADYKKKNLPFVFDDEHSKSPNDGRELLIQNMTVMPNFRLTDQDARDIASFLMTQKRNAQYPSSSWLDDQSLKAEGEKLVRRYGCAGCHEIKGFEEEQRIGTELTLEGSKPIERLDFALLQQPAMRGLDPITGEKIERRGREKWYDHKGFFENKLRSPGIYDRGKEKTPEERLRMPNIFLNENDITALTTFLLGSVETSLPESMRYNPTAGRKSVQEGWWVVQKYNCAGCHNVLIGQDSVLMGLSMYQDADGKEQLPPRLTTEGARVNPDWLLRFLRDPSLATPQERAQLLASVVSHGPAAAAAKPAANGQPPPNGQAAAEDWSQSLQLHAQPGVNRNGVRRYLRARMPTFNFSPNELQALINFFMGASDQPQPYIAEHLEPMTPEEQGLGRTLFTSDAAPCLKCHMTGDPAHDARATAPNFLLAPERLKPSWTKRWLLDPAMISPGTSMPSGLFRRDTGHDRWVSSGPPLAAFRNYEKDHVDLLVRYMFQITPEEQRRLGTGGGGATAAPAAAGTAKASMAGARRVRTGIAGSSSGGRAP
jgi:cytochrome c2